MKNNDFFLKLYYSVPEKYKWREVGITLIAELSKICPKMFR